MAKKFRSQISAEIEICPVIETDVKKRTFPHIMHQTIDNSVFNKLNKRKQSYFKNNLSIINHSIIDGFNDIDRAISKSNSTYVHQLFEFGYKSEFIENDQEKHTHPSLYILGDQDVEVGYQDALNQMNTYTNVEVHCFKQASHFLMWEYPSLFQSTMNQFLKSIICDK